MPDKIGKLCSGQNPASVFVSKQKCAVKETSLFPAKWKSVHLNTQLAHLGFDPTHFLCDPRRLPVRLSVSTQGLEKSFVFSWRRALLRRGGASANMLLFATAHMSKKLTRDDKHTSPWTRSKCSLLHTSRDFQAYLNETMILLHVSI